eukprot:CAMPEP_0194447228 /NCGR_PEP_ID=MMETSP0176-20130528/128892_1 /TAXON_ID=216777 /ORGANISM="Proboscia alata, Strain PI-D3" /LENGTH=244 /DNA_ID=CAMNT_0039274061 /DNA_START=538 /DNA_END=1272 /DNA_ORIENTATION=-
MAENAKMVQDDKSISILPTDDIEILIDRVTGILLLRIVSLVNARHVGLGFSVARAASVSGVGSHPHHQLLLPKDITADVIFQLRKFVTAIAFQYHPTARYHCFQHGYHVLLGANKLLTMLLQEDDDNEKDEEEENDNIEEERRMLNADNVDYRKDNDNISGSSLRSFENCDVKNASRVPVTFHASNIKQMNENNNINSDCANRMFLSVTSRRPLSAHEFSAPTFDRLLYVHEALFLIDFKTFVS